MSALRGLFVAIPVLLLALGSGCATIVAGGPDKVEFTSEPTGASVSIDGVSVGRTPVSAKVARSAKFVTLSMPGHADTVLPVARHFNGWVLGNLVFGGIIGIIIDFSAGNDSKADSTMHGNLRLPPEASRERLANTDAPPSRGKDPPSVRTAPVTARKAPASAKTAPATARKASTAKKAPATAQKVPSKARTTPAIGKDETDEIDWSTIEEP